MTLQRIGPAVAVLAVFTVACGSSPTAPSLTTSTAAAQPAGQAGASSLSAAALRLESGPCGIQAIGLEVVPSIYRNAQAVEAVYKGDTTFCSVPVWSASPATRLVSHWRNPNVVSVFDDPANKKGVVDVTATVQVGKASFSQTLRITFERGRLN